MASMSYRGNTTTAIANGAFSDAVPQPPLVIAIPASQKPQNSQTTETPQTTPSKTTPTHPIKATPTQTPQTPQTQTQTPNAQTANAQTKPRTHRVSPLAALVAKICNVLFFTILLVIILGAASLLTAQALGYTPLAILSGSMEP
ncbi:MAG: hypothetical protein LBH56_01800, partial [Coriobacteriales bacterium]|nr:hypothetical protein [Coriobacteriales bacterium]